MKLIQSTVTVILAGLVVACGSGDPSSQEKQETATTANEAQEPETPQKVRTFLLPSTVQIAALFKDAGLKYVSNITNPVSRVSDYSTRSKRLLNYGVYSTDLTYCALNNQSQQAVEYLKAVEELSQSIGFSEIFEGSDLLQRFESNLGNPDSLELIMVEIQENTDFFVEDNNRKLEALVVFIGGWVEGMYIGVKASKELDKGEISNRVVEQMAILDNLLSGLDYLQARVPELTPLHDQLVELHTAYESSIDENEDGSRAKMGYAELSKLAKRIENIRTEIIQ